MTLPNIAETREDEGFPTLERWCRDPDFRESIAAEEAARSASINARFDAFHRPALVALGYVEALPGDRTIIEGMAA